VELAEREFQLQQIKSDREVSNNEILVGIPSIRIVAHYWDLLADKKYILFVPDLFLVSGFSFGIFRIVEIGFGGIRESWKQKQIFHRVKILSLKFFADIFCLSCSDRANTIGRMSRRAQRIAANIRSVRARNCRGARRAGVDGGKKHQKFHNKGNRILFIPTIIRHFSPLTNWSNF